MSKMQQKRIDNIERRLRELESFGEELLMNQEPGLEIRNSGLYKILVDNACLDAG